MSPPAASRLLEIDKLRIELKIGGRWRAVVQDVSLALAAGETIGIVGESGSGKSVTARSIARLLPPGARVTGEVRFDGDAIWAMTRTRLRKFRAHDLGIIYQDPRAHINTVHSIGDFLTEGVRDLGPRERRELAISTLSAVGITDPERRLKQFPHQLSGGLLQRVMIAAAIMPGPRLLLADEPTTALDVTTQSEVMAVLDEQRQARNLAMVFITHDLDLAAAVTDTIAVMYAGTIVETGPSAGLHERALHPYTAGLLASRPQRSRVASLYTIPGRPIAAYESGDGCVFAGRCAYAQQRCQDARPEPRQFGDHVVACHRAEELRGTLHKELERA
ncbi:MAG: ABC transporter ATP-binding protein [Nocardiopsaceae bacterium]|jgi:oligopeptide/dipeptide ABC transporter ATP-binding protein|nr:ABC transporter ATP-binding protein [Nocardiopsaceae bacterium]